MCLVDRLMGRAGLAGASVGNWVILPPSDCDVGGFAAIGRFWEAGFIISRMALPDWWIAVTSPMIRMGMD